MLNTKERSEANYHLLKYGIVKSYTTWYFHGETSLEANGLHGVQNIIDDFKSDDDMVGLVNEIYGTSNFNSEVDGLFNSFDFSNSTNEEEPNSEASVFYCLLAEAKEKLHLERELSKLATIVKLLHLESFHKWTNRSFDGVLGLLRDIIPNEKKIIPESYNSARKYISDLGLNYVKYDVRNNNCTLYWGPYYEVTSCQFCGLSRWKSSEGLLNDNKVSHKVLRYFPLKPMLQRLFMSSKIASNMQWHKEKRVNYGIMQLLANSPAWKSLDEQHVTFAKDARNVRLGLAIDGFNSFGNMSSQHSI